MFNLWLLYSDSPNVSDIDDVYLHDAEVALKQMWFATNNISCYVKSWWPYTLHYRYMRLEDVYYNKNEHKISHYYSTIKDTMQLMNTELYHNNQEIYKVPILWMACNCLHCEIGNATNYMIIHTFKLLLIYSWIALMYW